MIPSLSVSISLNSSMSLSSESCRASGSRGGSASDGSKIPMRFRNECREMTLSNDSNTSLIPYKC